PRLCISQQAKINITEGNNEDGSAPDAGLLRDVEQLSNMQGSAMAAVFRTVEKHPRFIADAKVVYYEFAVRDGAVLFKSFVTRGFAERFRRGDVLNVASNTVANGRLDNCCRPVQQRPA
ncbi:MAG: hypothetical protein ABJQ70_04380, partial [Roseobacter sp.]